GATLGFNFNEDIDGVNNPKWDQSYPSVLRSMIQAINLLGENTDRVNLLSMIRIWKAQVSMGLVDNYGDVPYFDAGKAVSDLIYTPQYDDDAVIYADLAMESGDAIGPLSPGGDLGSAELWYRSNAENPSGSAAERVEKWKKLGSSLLLRLGMRYSKVDASKAETIVKDAVSGGV